MKVAYQISRVLAVLFGLSATLNIINAAKGNSESGFAPAFFACFVFIGLSIYFGKRIKKSKDSQEAN